MNDTAVTLTDFETGFSLVDEGIKDLSVKKVEEGLKCMLYIYIYKYYIFILLLFYLYFLLI